MLCIYNDISLLATQEHVVHRAFKQSLPKHGEPVCLLRVRPCGRILRVNKIGMASAPGVLAGVQCRLQRNKVAV